MPEAGFEFIDPGLGAGEGEILNDHPLGEQVRCVRLASDLGSDEPLGLGIDRRPVGGTHRVRNLDNQFSFVRGHADLPLVIECLVVYYALKIVLNIAQKLWHFFAKMLDFLVRLTQISE